MNVVEKCCRDLVAFGRFFWAASLFYHVRSMLKIGLAPFTNMVKVVQVMRPI